MKEVQLSPQMKALKTTDLTPMIGMGGLMAPRMIAVFLPKLSEKQRKAFNKMMPAKGGMKFYTHLVGTPTPPIVIEMGQPMKMGVMSVEEVKKLKLKGLRLTVEDLQPLTEKKIGKFIWRIKGQLGTLLSLSGLATPLILLGPSELKDLINRAQTHFKPLIEMMPQ